jgi:alpha/beta superfamily hydrolase
MLLPSETRDIVVEEVAVPSGRWRLHGELAYPDAEPIAGVAVLAGPHPLLGGTLQNSVARGVGDGLARRGIATLRFDYHGAGKSEGPRIDVARHLAEFWATSHVADELNLAQDVQAAIAYLTDASCVGGNRAPLMLIGYSFGCALLAHVPEPWTLLALIAPTIGKHAYDAFLTMPNPILVIASQDDFASDRDRLHAWYGALPGPRQLIHERFDNHFFRGHEDVRAATGFDFFQAHRSAGT